MDQVTNRRLVTVNRCASTTNPKERLSWNSSDQSVSSIFGQHRQLSSTHGFRAKSRNPGSQSAAWLAVKKYTFGNFWMTKLDLKLQSSCNLQQATSCPAPPEALGPRAPPAPREGAARTTPRRAAEERRRGRPERAQRAQPAREASLRRQGCPRREIGCFG